MQTPGTHLTRCEVVFLIPAGRKREMENIQRDFWINRRYCHIMTIPTIYPKNTKAERRNENENAEERYTLPPLIIDERCFT